MLSAIKQSLTEYLTIKEAAQLLGVSSWTLRNWDKTGKLKPKRHPINGYRIYRHEDLEALLQENDSPDSSDSGFAPYADWTDMGDSDHFVQFYEHDDILVNSISGFIGVALEKGQGGIVVATPPHRAGIEKALEARGIDVAAAVESGQYACLDAAQTLSMFMVDGMPDPQRFRHIIGGVMTQMMKKYTHLRAFGEMVAILWKEDNRQAAIRVEELWNELGKDYTFSLFCAYPLNAFAGTGDGELSNKLTIDSVCKCHSKIIPAENYAALLTPQQRLQAISRLQQKASLLEAEIAHRKEVEKSLVKREQELSDFFENAIEGIHKVGADGIILAANKAELGLLGYTSEEYIGHHISEFHADQDVIADILRRLQAGETLINYEAPLRCKNGDIKHVLINSNVCWEDGKFLYTRCFTHDVTEKKHIEKELHAALEKAQTANIAKTEFLANMSHEIRTPMNAVIGLANILGISQPLTPKQKEFIKTLKLSADSLLSLINDLLDISKIEARTIELEHIPFCLTQLTQEVISMMSVRLKEKNLALTTDAEYVRNRMFIGDPARLRQIILNLCSNAVKFTGHGGIHVAITCEASAKPGTEMVRIAIMDTGIGIPSDKLDDIFQKFVQADTTISRKYGGTGLGLTITRTLVELMGGTIEVKSALGEGSIFTVSLPLTVAITAPVENAAAEAAKINAPMESPDRPRILLVEDYAANILVATTFLEHFGYAYDLAKNGIEAIERVKTGHYTAILMDVQMHGMNGFEATQLIREHEKQSGKPRVLIIGMTAHALAGDRERCIASGMDDYISKPFNPDALREKLALADAAAQEAA